MFHLSTTGIKWTEFTTAVATAAYTVITVVAAVVAYLTYRSAKRAAAKADSDKRSADIAKCDVQVLGQCYSYKGADLLRVAVSIKNHSARRLEIRSDLPPSVRVLPYSDAMLRVDTPPTWNHSFADVDPLVVAAAMDQEQMIEPTETLTDTLLLPVVPPGSIAAYRVEFVLSLVDPVDQQIYSWRAVDFVAVTMTLKSVVPPSGWRRLRWVFG